MSQGQPVQWAGWAQNRSWDVGERWKPKGDAAFSFSIVTESRALHRRLTTIRRDVVRGRLV